MVYLLNMKKNIFVFIFILISLFFLTGSPYENIFWEDHFKQIFRFDDSRVFPSKIVAKSSLTYDHFFDLSKGLYYEISEDLYIIKAFSINSKLRFGENIPKLNVIDAGFEFFPLTFFKFTANYRFRDFSKYKVGEHNIIVNMEFLINLIKYFHFSLYSGLDFRFTDLNIYDTRTVFKRDWTFYIYIIGKLRFMFHPLFFYSFGFSLGNIDEFQIFSHNYVQFEMENYFHLPEGFSVFLNGGFAYAGFLPGAGNIDRFWIRTGLRYEVKFR